MVMITSPADVIPALAALNAIKAAEADKQARYERNRRILLRALAQGCEYIGHDGEGCY